MRRLAQVTAGLLGSEAGLGVVEQTIRAALLATGAQLLGRLLAGDVGYRGPRIDCGQGHQATFVDYRPKQIDTVLGRVELRRAYYHCAPCGRGLAPRDEDLGVAGSSLSPGPLAQMTALAGAQLPFAQATDLVGELAGIELNVRRLERAAETAGAAALQAAAEQTTAVRARTLIPAPPPAPRPGKLYVEVDGTGVPVRPSETIGRAGKADDGQARTREVKLARIFTQSSLDAKGRPAIDPHSSSYVHTFDGVETFTGHRRIHPPRRSAHPPPNLPRRRRHPGHPRERRAKRPASLSLRRHRSDHRLPAGRASSHRA